MHTPQAVTQLLERWSGGDRAALDELMPLVYDELRRLAGNYLRRERPDHTLQPTALVNEAYMLMVDQRRARWQNRAQFVGVAAQMMRRILVDHARAVQAEKRGGRQFAVSLTEAEGFGESPDLDLLRVNEALERLAALDPSRRASSSCASSAASPSRRRPRPCASATPRSSATGRWPAPGSEENSTHEDIRHKTNDE